MAGDSALYPRSVYPISTAFQGLRCHPPTCMLLKIRLVDNSIPTASTIRFNNLANTMQNPTPQTIKLPLPVARHEALVEESPSEHADGQEEGTPGGDPA